MPRADLHELAAEYRSEFPILESSIYLNSCSLGALSRRVRAAIDEFTAQWSARGAAAWYDLWLSASDDVRSGFASLIGAAPHEVALAPNVSGALNVVASALDLRGRPRVVTTELDFPTVVYPFLARRRLGVETVVLPSPDGCSVPIEAFEAAIDERTALVVTSHVYYTSGVIQDVAAIADLAHARGALCFIDAYQSIGQVPADASALGADFLVAGGLKWLLGGPGIAYLYAHEAVARRLEPAATGWFAVSDPFAFAPDRLELRADARRFELGTPSVAAVYAGRAGLQLVGEIGVERIHRRVRSLTGHVIDRARAAGLRVRAALDGADRSGIVMIEQEDPAGAVRGLAELGVIVDWRKGAVRVSPHFYNTTDEIETAVDRLGGLAGH